MLIKFRDICQHYSFVPKGIIHVGAHNLEEMGDYQSMGVQKIIWIEGNPDIVERNSKRMFNYPEQKLLHGLVWENDGMEMDFHITNNGESSSILEFGKHAEYHPHVQVIDKKVLTTSTLNTLVESVEGFNPEDYNFLNLDIQGVELRAIKGFDKYLSHIDYIYTEVNSGEVYINNDSITEMDSYLAEKGFDRGATYLTQYEWGDAIYVRRK